MGIKSASKNYHVKLINHIYNQIPAFTDIFTEESFYMFVIAFVSTTIVCVFILSKFITIRPVD